MISSDDRARALRIAVRAPSLQQIERRFPAVMNPDPSVIMTEGKRYKSRAAADNDSRRAGFRRPDRVLNRGE